MASNILYLIASACFATAQLSVWPSVPDFGDGPAPHGDQYDLLVSAGRTPNATSSVTFSPSAGLGSSGGNWTWRVNITDVSIPDSQVSPDPRVVLTQYDLSWPGNYTNLNAELANFSGKPDFPLCATVVTMLSQNYSNKLTASDDGDCSSALGNECVQSIQASGNPFVDGACQSSNAFNALQGCRVGDMEAIPIQLGNSSAAVTHNASNFSDYQEFNGFYFNVTEAEVGSNNTSYHQALDTLQLLILGGGDGRQSTVLCQRVSHSGSSSSANSSSSPSSASTTSAAGREAVVGWGMMGFAGLAAALALM